MDEDRFWNMIETAWEAAGGLTAERAKLATGKLEEDAAYALMDSAEEMIPALEAALGGLSQEDLVAFDRILERKLYDIDREEIHEHTDGSDDGFLYCRGFIVAAGRAYYDAVNAKPSIAIMDCECEAMCYLPVHVHLDKFGEMSKSDISRETGANDGGW